MEFHTLQDPEWQWGVALSVSTVGAMALILLCIWLLNCLRFRTDLSNPADDKNGCCNWAFNVCWDHPWNTKNEVWSTITALLHFMTIGLGWMVLIWGGILIGSLFRTLNAVDYWWLFAVWMTENLTKFLYMHPEGDFYHKFDVAALHSAARHYFNKDPGCCGGCFRGITVVAFFDALQFGFAVGRGVVAGMALCILSARRHAGQCSAPTPRSGLVNSTHLHMDIVYLANTTSDPYLIQFDNARVCSALTIFYVLVLTKAAINICKMFLVVCMADIGGEKYCADGLVSILVHEQHGFSMKKKDLELAQYEGKLPSLGMRQKDALRRIYEQLPNALDPPLVAPTTMEGSAQHAAYQAAEAVRVEAGAARQAGVDASAVIAALLEANQTIDIERVAKEAAIAAVAARGLGPGSRTSAGDAAAQAIKWWRQQHSGNAPGYNEALYAAAAAVWSVYNGTSFATLEHDAELKTPVKWPWAPATVLRMV